MSDPILSTVIGLDVGDEIDLFIIDLRTAGYDAVLYFTPSDQLGTSIWFGGREYTCRPISISGLEKNSDDAPPTPTLSFGNLDKGGNALLSQYNDLLKAKVTRITTFGQFLDKLPDGSDNPTKDANAMLLPEVYYVQQKIGGTPAIITWRLSSVLDLHNKQIPARLVLKDVCGRAYRSWDPVNNRWLYPTVNACPYTGAGMWDRSGNPVTDPAKDKCPRGYGACGLRFPTEDLPGWFFPGVTRLPS